MKKILFTLITVFTVTGVQAESQKETEHEEESWQLAEDTWEFDLGIGVAKSQSLYKGLDSKASAMPIIGARYNQFFFESATIGYEFYQSEEQSAFVSISMDDPFDGERSDSKNSAISRLGDVDSGVNLSVGGEFFTPVGLLTAEVSADVSGEHGGSSVSVGWAAPIEYNQFRLMPNVSVTWASDDLVNHYYGVSTKQALKTGLSKYKTGSATVVNLGLNAEYDVSEQWSILGGVSYSTYSSNVKNSPLTVRDHSTDVFFGTSYRF